MEISIEELEKLLNAEFAKGYSMAMEDKPKISSPPPPLSPFSYISLPPIPRYQEFGKRFPE